MRSVLHTTPCTYRQQWPTFPARSNPFGPTCAPHRHVPEKGVRRALLSTYAQLAPSCCWMKIAPPVPMCNSPFSRLLSHEHYLSRYENFIRSPKFKIYDKIAATPSANEVLSLLVYIRPTHLSAQSFRPWCVYNQFDIRNPWLEIRASLSNRAIFR